MKKALLLSAVLLAVGACQKASGPSDDKKVNLEAIETLADYQVPVQAGKATIVTLGQDTLAITTQSMTAKVPRYALEDGLINVTYSEDEIYMKNVTNWYWQYLAFEDTRFADYDYNDIVFHARVVSEQPYGKNTWNNRIDIQPVALGSSTPIKIGILYQETPGVLISKILVEDARSQLFNGDPRFPINTDKNKEIKQVSRKLTNFFTQNDASIPLRVVWFIEAKGVRLYAASSQVDENSLEMVSPDGLPYGISLTKKWDYPVEKMSIEKAYTAFREWVKTGNETKLLNSKVRANTFPATIPIDGYDLWDYEKVK